jgi:hypothetical protein
MPVQGRRNLENAKWAIEALGKSLRAAVKEYEIPATVTHFLNGRYPYDLVVRPFLPGASFGPTGINSIFWTNTEHRNDALYWSREFEGFRLHPRYRPDKALGLARWMAIEDPYREAQAWLAVVTRAISPDGSFVCSWAPMADVMGFYARQPSLPAAYLATCLQTPYDAKSKKFIITADAMAAILGVKGVAA